MGSGVKGGKRTGFSFVFRGREQAAQRPPGVARTQELLRGQVFQFPQRRGFVLYFFALDEALHRVQREVDQRPVGTPTHIKVPKQHVGTEVHQRLVDDVFSLCWRCRTFQFRPQRAHCARAHLGECFVCAQPFLAHVTAVVRWHFNSRNVRLRVVACETGHLQEMKDNEAPRVGLCPLHSLEPLAGSLLLEKLERQTNRARRRVR